MNIDMWKLNLPNRFEDLFKFDINENLMEKRDSKIDLSFNRYRKSGFRLQLSKWLLSTSRLIGPINGYKRRVYL